MWHFFVNMVTKVDFEDKNELLTRKDVRDERGWIRMDDGHYFVASSCDMPGVTKEMLNWWFWWHPQNSERYQMWFPGEHYRISYAKCDQEYFTAQVMPPFKPNRQLPVERVGNVVLPLAIDFVTPEDFGFAPEVMQRERVGTIICGHVSALWGAIPNTEMAHIAFEKEDGIQLMSRFWLGKNVSSRLLRMIFVTEANAQGMAAHCIEEYTNLARILPDLYHQHHG